VSDLHAAAVTAVRTAEAAPSTSLARRMLRSPAFVAGAVITLAVVLVAVLAPVIAPVGPITQDLGASLLPPGSPGHPLGTDQLGRDILARLVYAARTDLRIAVLAVIAPAAVGTLVGTVSGYLGGPVDWIIGRITDTVVAFPFYVIVIAVVFAFGAGELGILAAMALVGWVTYARVIRSMTASLRGADWVLAARGGGLSAPRVLVRHVLPNTISQAIVLLMNDIVFVMVAVVTLSYLGLGIQPPTPDWGTMILDGQAFVATRWWISAIPGAAVLVTGIGLSLLADGIADAGRTR
jgi:peptide/nickel transport system permease protein